MTRWLALVCLAACAHELDWSRPPELTAPAAFAPPRATRVVLDDGMQVVLVENRRLPLVAIAAVNHAAGSREDGAQHGLAALTADLLDEGFGAALELAGARLDIDIATDAATLELQVQPQHLAQALDLLAEALAQPRYTSDDVIRVRAERVARLTEHRANARTTAAQRFDALVFGDHPYAHPAEGEPDAVAALTEDDVRRFHAHHYAPSETTIIIAGDFPRGIERDLARRFAAWKSEAPRAPRPVVPAAHAPGISIVDRPGATTAVIVAGGRGQPASAPDRIAAELANTALGGAPTSRLDRRFHDELDLSLAASSSFWRGEAAGSWAIATTVQTADAKRAIAELRAQLAAAREQPFSAAELATARTQLLRALPHAFETNLGTLRTFERLVIQHMPLDYYATVARRFAETTPEAARAAIATLWTDPIIVVVGDAAALELP